MVLSQKQNGIINLSTVCWIDNATVTTCQRSHPTVQLPIKKAMNASDISADTNLIIKMLVTERILCWNKKYDHPDAEMLAHGSSDTAIC